MNSFSPKLGFSAVSREPGRTSQNEVATIRVRDLESQLCEEPAAAPQSFWSIVLSCCLLRRDKKRSTLQTCKNQWTAEYDSGPDIDINSYRSYMLETVHIPTADDVHNYAPTTNDDGKIAAHGSISQTCKDQWTEYDDGPDSGINPYRSYMLQAVQIPTENDGRNSATTTNDDGKIAAHGSIPSIAENHGARRVFA